MLILGLMGFNSKSLPKKGSYLLLENRLFPALNRDFLASDFQADRLFNNNAVS
jgi:hypothetical protein